MSLAIPGSDGTSHLRTGSAFTSRRVVLTAGLTSTMPATASGWSAARRSTSEPPIDRPPTTTASFSARSFSKARDVSAYQSFHPTVLRSCHDVP